MAALIALLGKRWGLALGAVLLLGAASAGAQEPRKFAFRATHYEVTATLVPAEQRLAGRVKVELVAASASRTVEVELHPSLKVNSVLGSDGKPAPFERDAETPLVLRVTLHEPAVPGQKFSLWFDYAGPLAGEEDSPIRGVRVAQVSEEGSYLLLPARWFPLTDYPANRYTAVFQIVVPDHIAVVGTGTGAPPKPFVEPPPPAPIKKGAKPPEPSAPAAPSGKLVYTFRTERPEAAGTFVAGNLQTVPVTAEGLEIAVAAPPGAASATDYGQSVARIVDFFSDEFGSLPQPNLKVVQMPGGSLPGFSAPGLLLVSPRQWDPRVNYRLLAQLAAKQWWGGEVLPASAADVWITDGLARYSEALYVQQLAGPEGFHRALEDFAIAALMYEDAAPLAQAGRLEPFTTQYRSVVLNKGATVFHMLRGQIGDDSFRALLRDFYARFAGKAARLEDFQKLAQEKVQPAGAGTDAAAPSLQPFFAQWLNSTGVPEFRLEYIVYRTQKGFKIVGKVKHDLETFRMAVDLRVDTEGNPELKRIEVIGSDSDFLVETFGRPKPNGITLDPNNQLLKSSPKLRVRASIARGEELAEAGEYYPAIQQYQRALELQKNNSLAHFRLGEAAFFQKNYQVAANAFRDALDGDLDLSYKWVEVWSHIYLGKIFDITGQRERAVNEYSKARDTNDDTGGAQAEVARYLNEPYKEESRP